MILKKKSETEKVTIFSIVVKTFPLQQHSHLKPPHQTEAMHWICQNLRCVSMGNFPRWSHHTPAAPVFTHSHNSGQSHRFLLSSPPPPPSRPLFTRLTVYQANMSDRRWVSALCRGKYLKFTCGPRCPLQLHTHTAHAAALACRGCFTTVWLGPTVT